MASSSSSSCLLSSLASYQEPSSLILFTDKLDTHTQAKTLLGSFAQSALERSLKVVYVAFDTIKNIEFLDSRIHVIDACSDPWAWENADNSSWDASTLLTRIQTYTNGAGKVNKGCVVVIDSISQLLLRQPVDAVCRALKSVAKEPGIIAVVTSIHTDLHDRPTIDSFTHLASTHISLHDISSMASDRSNRCTILHKKRTGKVIRTQELLTVTNGKISSRLLTNAPKSNVADTPQADPAANLTFNLSLTSHQKEARSQLVLPYTMSEETHKSILVGDTGKGVVHYQPDDADDIDDDDPDDDLDI